MKWQTDTALDQLPGKRIAKVRVSDSVLWIETECGFVAMLEVEGDCCSESWFADINGVSTVFGKSVIEIGDVDLSGYNVDDGRGRQEEDSAYGFTISTEGGGEMRVIYRNSSNGYYGGWMQAYRGEIADSEFEDVLGEWTLPSQSG